VIAKDGAIGNEMYILLKGSVGVYKNYNGPNELQLTTLAAGSIFGEVALFSKRKRNVTIVALEQAVTLVIDSSNAFKFFSQEHSAAKSLCRVLCDRIAEDVKQCDLLKSPATENIYQNKFFPNFQANYDFAIAHPNESYMHSYSKGDVILEEGAKIDKIFVILHGKLGAYKSNELIAELSTGNFIIDTHYPSALAEDTIIALEGTQALVLDDKEFIRFFECEPKAYTLLQVLCDRLDLLSDARVALNINKSRVVGYKGHILFPDKHKQYDLPITTDTSFMKTKSYTCPVCGKLLAKKIADTARIKSKKVDDDFRMHYDELVPIYYDIVTCSACWYTALGEYFDKGGASLQIFVKRMHAYKSALKVNFGTDIDINDVFTSYYLGVLCGEHCFGAADKDLNYGKLWLRLSWLYEDCGDKDMMKYATENAKEYFLTAYNTVEFSAKTANPMMIIAGVLCYKVGDKANARDLLLRVSKIRTLDDRANEAHKEHAIRLLKEFHLE
ncbi:MAG: DUF2225 domain-containing protein, partial [Deferribacteraceae bacterium]|jgi:uncharacterized protein (DUF2225 family)/CRP-like cAMP-binding protein|nr:DUF2225 domain-containing protein [Deferribacteraceae bacterium]